MQPHYIKRDNVQCLVQTVIHKYPRLLVANMQTHEPRATPLRGAGPGLGGDERDGQRNFARQAQTGKLRTVERTAAQRDLRPAATDGHREPQRPATPRTTQHAANGTALCQDAGGNGCALTPTV